MKDSEESEITRGLLSPSLVMSESSSTVFRWRKSSVWDYFTYDSSTDKRFCKACVVDCSSVASTSSVESPLELPSTSTKLCGHVITKKYSTNSKIHLKNSQLLEYKELLKKDERQKAEKAEAEKAQRLRNPWVQYSGLQGSAYSHKTQAYLTNIA